MKYLPQVFSSLLLPLKISAIAVLVGCSNSSTEAVENTTTETTTIETPDTETANTATDSTAPITESPSDWDSFDPRSDNQGTSWAADSSELAPAPTPPDPPKPLKKRSAVLGYSYVPEIKRNDIKNINVFVSVNNAESQILEQLGEIVQDQAVTDEDTLVTKLGTKNISFYKYLDVTLLDPAKSFEITPVHNNSRQELQLNGSNRWRWAIKPTTDEDIGILIIKVVAETPDGLTDNLDEVNIPIKIEIEDGFLRRIYYHLLDNPEFLLSVILIPLIAYFGKRWLDRKK